MKASKRFLPGAGLTLLLVIATAFGLPGKIAVDSKYRVFCANGKIEVEQRTLEQEKNARGSSVCQLAEFEYLSDAEKEAEKRGGKGADCKCD
jgi:hypothetical protein